ncbi:adhesin-like protein [Methanobrevibacter ruminantium M1]|uniref:Adhesin-like protein n=2 Tax=Methanobrevibacter ruminantium TaxID=83816 RepID=D3E2H1_METRM|nr:adhesin-like protein [Methanobrevibacter ruminantium M1]
MILVFKMGIFDKVKSAFESSKNFKYLDDLIHSGLNEIVLDDDISLSKNEKNKYSNGIEIEIDNLVIDGNGHAIDAQGNGSIFLCTGKNIVVKNIHFKNGIHSNGGAIENRGELTIMDSTFDGNNASLGGAVFNDGPKLMIAKSTITGNIAKEGGGAIYNNDGEVYISESMINENVSSFHQYSGGAIYNKGELTIEKSTLIRNHASFGGAIGNIGQLNIIDSTISNNESSGDGGAIFNDNASLSISNSMIEANVSDGLEGGGAIYNKEGELNITGSVLKQNELVGQIGKGGAIYNNGGNLNIAGSSLCNHSINFFGGAIYNDGGKINIAESKFNENSSNRNGGAIYNEGEVNIRKSSIKKNKSDGGVIENINGDFKIFNCEFFSNESQGNIIFNQDSLEINYTDFKDNRSKSMLLNDGVKSKMSLVKGEINGNDVKDTLILNEGNSLTISETVFENNLIPNGDAIVNSSNLILTNPKINDDNQEIRNQGNLLLKRSSLDIKGKINGEGKIETDDHSNEDKFDFGYLDSLIHGSPDKEIVLDKDIKLENYEVDFYEGGIELDFDDLIINGNGKTIDARGKSRIFTISGKNITLKHITFKNGHSYKNYDNPLNNNGGAIRINANANLTITDCKFLDNLSEDYGGVIYYNGSGDLVLTASTMKGNTAENDGGAIFSSGEVKINKSKFINNSGNNGGAIAIVNSNDKASVTESIFNENAADSKGGAIWFHNSNIALADCTFNDNYATCGAAIYQEISKGSISNSTFKRNLSSYAYWHDGKLVTNKNHAIFIDTGSGLNDFNQDRDNIINCDFIDNNNNLYAQKHDLIKSRLDEHLALWKRNL